MISDDESGDHSNLPSNSSTDNDDPVVKIGPSLEKDGGSGLFAMKLFKGPKQCKHARKKTGDRILEYRGTQIGINQLPRDPSRLKYIAMLNKTTFLDASDPNTSSLARYCNRTLNGAKSNATLIKSGHRLWVAATKKIEKHEEILLAYNRSTKFDKPMSHDDGIILCLTYLFAYLIY
jgi:hypothetical protein